MEPSTSLNASVLSRLRHAQLDVGSPVGDLLRALAANLDADEAMLLPISIERVLPLLASDPDRLRLAADLSVAFDLFEVAPALLSLANRLRSQELALAAASLAANPGTDQYVFELVHDLPASLDASAAVRRALLIRLDPAIEAETKLERRLQSEAWPGKQKEKPTSPPIVAIDTVGAPGSLWPLAADLFEMGAVLRRIPETTRPGFRGDMWLPTTAAIVTWSTDAVSRLSRLGADLFSNNIVLAAHVPLTHEWKLARRVNQALGGALRDLGAPPMEESPEPLAADVIREGTLDALDMAFLGGSSRNLVYKLSSEGVLPASTIGELRTWSFSQLIALRTWRYFRSTSRRLLPSARLVDRLHSMAGSPTPRDVGVTSDGRVLQRENGHFVDVESGQRVFDEIVVSFDRVFHPFPLGGGQVPSLLNPSANTRVHPEALGGTPTLFNRRISVRALAELTRRHHLRAVEEVYPEVEPGLLQEAIGIGDRILAKR